MTLTLQERVVALKQAFQAIARHLADVPRRKNLVWITEGFPLFICNDLICVDFRPEMEEAARSLNDANVALRAADARAIRRCNLFARFLSPQRVTGRSSPRAHSRSPARRYSAVQIQLHVPEARARGGNRPTPDLLVKDPLNATQIGLLVSAAPDPARLGLLNVHVSVDLHDVQLYPEDAKWVGAVEVAFYIENSRSAEIATRRIEIPEDQLALALERGVGLDHAVESRGNAGQLRIEWWTKRQARRNL